MNADDETLEETGPLESARDRSEERRGDPRVAMLSTVTLRIPTAASGDAETSSRSISIEDGAELVRPSKSGDVSLGGMYLESTVPVAPGTEVEASFEVPGRDLEMTVPAEVRWSRRPERSSERSPWKFGIQFLDLSDRQRELLEAFVSSRKGE